jgi:hypothetical protein
MTQDSIVQRIRESLSRLGHVPPRISEEYQPAEETLRSSIRRVSQSRISQLLRQLRAAHGLSYADVQEQTGLSQQLLFDIEYKERRIALADLAKLAACYGVSIDDLLGVDLEES